MILVHAAVLRPMLVAVRTMVGLRVVAAGLAAVPVLAGALARRGRGLLGESHADADAQYEHRGNGDQDGDSFHVGFPSRALASVSATTKAMN